LVLHIKAKKIQYIVQQIEFITANESLKLKIPVSHISYAELRERKNWQKSAEFFPLLFCNLYEQVLHPEIALEEKICWIFIFYYCGCRELALIMLIVLYYILFL
jgi:hypothetical protein